MKIPVALDEDGNDVDAIDAEGGTDYYCPVEGCPNPAVRSVREHVAQARGRTSAVSAHFRHRVKSPLCTAGESLEHRQARKTMLVQMRKRIDEGGGRPIELRVPCAGKCGIDGRRVEVPTPEKVWGDREQYVVGPTGRLRYPDLTMEVAGRWWLVELRKSNPVTPEKRQDLEKHFWILLDVEEFLEQPFVWDARNYGPVWMCDKCVAEDVVRAVEGRPPVVHSPPGDGKNKPRPPRKKIDPEGWPSSTVDQILEEAKDRNGDERHRRRVVEEWAALSFRIAMRESDALYVLQSRQGNDRSVWGRPILSLSAPRRDYEILYSKDHPDLLQCKSGIFVRDPDGSVVCSFQSEEVAQMWIDRMHRVEAGRL